MCLALAESNLIPINGQGDLFEYRNAIRFKLQGDDVIVAFAKNFSDRERDLFLKNWAESYLRFGFDATVSQGNTFLMRHYNVDGTTSPVVWRVIQNTISSERPSNNVHIIRMGMAARSLGWSDLPRELSQQKQFAEAIIGEYNDGLRTILRMTDNQKKAVIVSASKELAGSRKGVNALIQLLIDQRFGATGTELARVISGTDLESYINGYLTKERSFFEWSFHTLGIEDDLHIGSRR
jgi:hypothetical protein